MEFSICFPSIEVVLERGTFLFYFFILVGIMVLSLSGSAGVLIHVDKFIATLTNSTCLCLLAKNLGKQVSPGNSTRCSEF